MAFFLDRATVLHVPKTGGTWCHQVFYEQGLLRGVLHSPANYPHPSAAEVRAIVGADAFVCAFVRHPVSWLRSYWASACLANGHGVERLRFPPSPWSAFAACEAPTFEAFARAYLDHCPGEVGRLFDRYTVGAAFIGRYEVLLSDLATALSRAGQPFNWLQAAHVAPINVAGRLPLGPIADLSPDGARAICVAERACLEVYDYKASTT